MNEYGRLAAFSAQGKRRWGAVVDRGMIDLSARNPQWPTMRDAIAAGALRQLAESAARVDVDFGIGDFRFAIPVSGGEKIICVGINYPARNEEYKDTGGESKYPSLFIRFPESFVAHEEALVRPAESRQLDYEGEFAIVIGKAGRHISEGDALGHIAGVTLCNEGTVRDWTRHGKFNVTQGKNFDASGSLGPWLIPYVEESQIADIKLTTKVNGELRQQDSTRRMIFPFRKLINYISTFTTLAPGDVIVTGTPIGAGARYDPPKWLAPGDVLEIEAQGVGILRNGVVDEERAA